MEPIKCPKCGSSCSAEAKFCSTCGSALDQTHTSNNPTQPMEDTTSAETKTTHPTEQMVNQQSTQQHMAKTAEQPTTQQPATQTAGQPTAQPAQPVTQSTSQPTLHSPNQAENRPAPQPPAQPTNQQTTQIPKQKNSGIKFYQKPWFMWVMLIFFAPVGIFLIWKYHPEIKKGIKIVLTVVFALWFIFLCTIPTSIMQGSSSSNTSAQRANTSAQKADVTIIDFSTMDKTVIKNWCNDKKITCNITDEYSDSVAKGGFVSQSVPANSTLKEGGTIKVVFSSGPKPTTQQTNALKKAESYSKNMHMSKQGIYDQLTSEYGEGFPADAAQYAIDNIEADWNANALAKAKTYQTNMHMSKSAIYNQLISAYGEKFTEDEAQYAVDNLPE